MNLLRAPGALCFLIVVVLWGCAASQEPTAAAEPLGVSAEQMSPPTAETANRIQAKISRVVARATKILESGGDPSWLQREMQEVDRLLKAGDHVEGERRLDAILRKLGEPVEAATAQQTTGRQTTRAHVGRCRPHSSQNRPGWSSRDEDQRVARGCLLDTAGDAAGRSPAQVRQSCRRRTHP